MMISFQKPKHGSLVFCLFGKVHPCGGGPRPAVFDCQGPDKTKVVPPWGPERANQDRRVGGPSMNVGAKMLGSLQKSGHVVAVI